jgi:hypothetical protein
MRVGATDDAAGLSLRIGHAAFSLPNRSAKGVGEEEREESLVWGYKLMVQRKRQRRESGRSVREKGETSVGRFLVTARRV